MKGNVMLLTISLIVALALVTAIFVGFNRNLAGTARANAGSYALEIAGIVNILKISPDKTTYTYTPVGLPEKCRITINDWVAVETERGNKRDYITRGIISGGPDVVPAEIECEEAAKIQFVKDNGRITAGGIK